MMLYMEMHLHHDLEPDAFEPQEIGQGKHIRQLTRLGFPASTVHGARRRHVTT